MRYTSRFLERRDLLHFLSGQLLGFALDDFFEGAYLGAFDDQGRPAGFIFTGHVRSDGEILIGVPHPVGGAEASPELESYLVCEAVEAAGARASVVIAAVYSDQPREEIARLQDIYRRIGFRYNRDSTILSRSLEDVAPPGDLLQSRGFQEVGPEVLAAVARVCAAGTAWSDVDFSSYISTWSRGARFDPELFRLARIGGEPAAVLMARIDSLDPREGAFYFLGVLPHFRGRGLGRALLGEGLWMLRERGATRTRQNVPASDGASLRLLESAGYQVQEWARYFRLSRNGQASAASGGGGMV